MNNQQYIYENHGDEKTGNILLAIKKYVLKEDILSPYMEKETFLYNHPALTEISQYAIKTDSFNFIHADYFQKLSILPNEWGKKLIEIENLHDDLLLKCINKDFLVDTNDDILLFAKMDGFSKEIKELINNLPNIKFFTNITNESSLNPLNHLSSLTQLNIQNPIAKISDEKFLKILDTNKIQSYDAFKQQVNNFKHPDDSFNGLASFNPKDQKFIFNFKQKTLPEFMNIFKKLIKNNEKEEALHLTEFFAASVGQQAGKLNDFGFSIFVHTLFSHKFEKKFSQAIIKGIHKSDDIGETKRNILVEEASHTANSPLRIIRDLTVTELPASRKKFDI